MRTKDQAAVRVSCHYCVEGDVLAVQTKLFALTASGPTKKEHCMGLWLDAVCKQKNTLVLVYPLLDAISL